MNTDGELPRERGPESDNSNLGNELTQKIAELMRTPKSDMSPEELNEYADSEEFGPEVAEELRDYDRSLMTAYYDPDLMMTAYLSMPEPGNPQLFDHDETRWEIYLMIPAEIIDDAKLVKTYDIFVDERTFAVNMFEDTLVYRNGKIDKQLPSEGFPPEQMLDNVTELERIFRDQALQERLSLGRYNEAVHIQIMELLGSFKPEQEIEGYDPARGVGI